MSIEEMGALVALALADSTSVGTLVIPVWLVMRPKVEAKQILVYLATLAGFYWAVGLVLLVSMSWITAAAQQLSSSEVWLWSQLSIGMAVLIAGLLIDRQRARATSPSHRLEKWRSRSLTPTGLRGAAMLAIAAGALELAGMLPFLAAVGLITRAGLEPAFAGAILAGYVLIMMLPAVALLTIRTIAGDRISQPLRRLEQWLSRHSDALIATVLMVVGGLLAADAAIRLDLFPN